MVFMGCGFTSRGQELGSVFSAAVCTIHASKCHVESLPLVPKDRRSCFSQGERFTVQLPLNRALALQKMAKITGSVLHIFNQLHAQCSVCTTVAPRLLDTCGKLPGTLTVLAVLEPVRSCTIKNPFYHPFYPDITHVRKNTRPSPAFLFWIEATESWVGPGNKATH